MRKTDVEWFQAQARASPYGSLRQLAAAIRGRSGKPLDPASLVRSLHGQREFTLSELEQLAWLLRVPLMEVLQRCGADIDVHRKKRRPTPL